MPGKNRSKDHKYKQSNRRSTQFQDISHRMSLRQLWGPYPKNNELSNEKGYPPLSWKKINGNRQQYDQNFQMEGESLESKYWGYEINPKEQDQL